MSHNIQAVIARREPLAAACARFPSACVRNLAQGFAILPLTDDLEEEWNELLVAGESLGRCEPQGVLPQIGGCENVLLCELSRSSPTAYVATNYYGSQGYQSAAVWRDGRVIFGFASDKDGGVSEPINQALRLLGVVATEGHDEFTTIGLAGERNNDGWANRQE